MLHIWRHLSRWYRDPADLTSKTCKKSRRISPTKRPTTFVGGGALSPTGDRINSITNQHDRTISITLVRNIQEALRDDMTPHESKERDSVSIKNDFFPLSDNRTYKNTASLIPQVYFGETFGHSRRYRIHLQDAVPFAEGLNDRGSAF